MLAVACITGKLPVLRDFQAKFFCQPEKFGIKFSVESKIQNTFNMNNVEAQTSPGITVEYLLVGVFLVILAFEKRVRKYFSNVRFRDREAHQVKYYEFDNLPGPSCYPIIGSLHHVTEYRSKISK